MVTFSGVKAFLDSPAPYLVLAAIVATVMGVLKAFIEGVPRFGPGDRLHDSAIQGVTLLLSFGAACWWAKAANMDTGYGLLALVNGFVIALSAMGGYSAIAKRLGFTGLSQGDGGTPINAPSIAMRSIQERLSTMHEKLDQLLQRGGAVQIVPASNNTGARDGPVAQQGVPVQPPLQPSPPQQQQAGRQ